MMIALCLIILKKWDNFRESKFCFRPVTSEKLLARMASKMKILILKTALSKVLHTWSSSWYWLSPRNVYQCYTRGTLKNQRVYSKKSWGQSCPYSSVSDFFPLYMSYLGPVMNSIKNEESRMINISCVIFFFQNQC